MKLRSLLVVLALVASPVFAQQATLNTPVARASEDNFRVESYFGTRDSGGRWQVEVSVRDNASNEIRRVTFSGPDTTHPGATAAAFNTALITVRSGETGTDVRKANFRVLGFLSDQAYISGVTLVP